MGARRPVVTADQKRQWADDGYTVLPALFTHRECDELVRYQTALREGRVPPPPGFSPRQREEWGRSMNQHVNDPKIREWLTDPRLGAALEQLVGEPSDGIQSMYFWRSDSANGGSPGGWHQDQTPLPGCYSTQVHRQSSSCL